MRHFDIKKSYDVLIPILLYLALFIYIYTLYYSFFVLFIIIAFIGLILLVIFIDRDLIIYVDDNRIIINKLKSFMLPAAQQVIYIKDIKRIKQIKYSFTGYRGWSFSNLACHIIILNNKKQIRIPLYSNTAFDNYIDELNYKLKKQSEEYNIYSHNDEKKDKNFEKLLGCIFYGILIFCILFLLFIPYIPRLQGWE